MESYGECWDDSAGMITGITNIGGVSPDILRLLKITKIKDQKELSDQKEILSVLRTD